jgi:hypothetical protein
VLSVVPKAALRGAKIASMTLQSVTRSTGFVTKSGIEDLRSQKEMHWVVGSGLWDGGAVSRDAVCVCV